MFWLRLGLSESWNVYFVICILFYNFILCCYNLNCIFLPMIVTRLVVSRIAWFSLHLSSGSLLGTVLSHLRPVFSGTVRIYLQGIEIYLGVFLENSWIQIISIFKWLVFAGGRWCDAVCTILCGVFCKARLYAWARLENSSILFHLGCHIYN